MKAAIFDLDGTLVDSLMLWNVIWKKFGKRYIGDDNFAPSEEIDKAIRTLVFKDALKLIHEKCGFGESAEELYEAGNEIIKEFYARDVKLKDGVREYLEYLKGQGVKMCIASATVPELIRLTMQSCDIKEYFSHVISCTELGCNKDKPDVYIAAAKLLGESHNETWVFEDSLVALKTAASIGMPTVGIYDKYNYGHDEMKRIATEYIDEGESLMRLAN